jgi:hypothetical protein
VRRELKVLLDMLAEMVYLELRVIKEKMVMKEFPEDKDLQDLLDDMTQP